ncbi:transposable element Tcb1 transposase [Trichonephila clavipes]|nr:transposable element Tcb1 transposase [Trichonephila clavipes]
MAVKILKQSGRYSPPLHAHKIKLQLLKIIPTFKSLVGCGRTLPKPQRSFAANLNHPPRSHDSLLDSGFENDSVTNFGNPWQRPHSERFLWEIVTSGKIISSCYRMSRVLPNSTDKLRGMMAGSMGITNHHGTGDRKSCLVGEILKNSYKGYDVECNERDSKRPVRCVPLTATHCRLRSTWSSEHALWTSQQWSCVMFSDESRFSLQSDSRRTLIWKAPGTRYHQENTIE